MQRQLLRDFRKQALVFVLGGQCKIWSIYPRAWCSEIPAETRNER